MHFVLRGQIKARSAYVQKKPSYTEVLRCSATVGKAINRTFLVRLTHCTSCALEV
jgi:hypothetical protein